MNFARRTSWTSIMRLAGVDLEWPPVKLARQVALCGVRLLSL